jgi:hypothetical protein
LSGRNSWILLKERSEKGTFRKIELQDKFDQKLLFIDASFYSFNDFNFGYLNISYNNHDGDFGSTETQSDGAWMLIDPNGERHDIEMDNRNHIENQYNNEKGKRIYIFSNSSLLSKFRAYISKEVQPQIDDGLRNIDSINFDDENLRVIIVGSRLDVTSLPDPDIGWAREDFGDFSVSDE